jgi:hypothetical protein
MQPYVLCSEAVSFMCRPLQEMKNWDADRARRHCQSQAAYRGTNKWTGSRIQVFELVESDFLYQCRAFKHVVPAKPLTTQESEIHMTEVWRIHCKDLGYFKCKHCRQFSKARFCEEVTTFPREQKVPPLCRVHPYFTADIIRMCSFAVRHRHDRGKRLE